LITALLFRFTAGCDIIGRAVWTSTEWDTFSPVLEAVWICHTHRWQST